MWNECIVEWIIKQPNNHYVLYTVLGAEDKKMIKLTTAVKALIVQYCTEMMQILWLKYAQGIDDTQINK